MKKSIALVAFLGSALFSSVAFGQTTKSQMSVNLTVNLHPMISIQIDGGGVIDNTGEFTDTDGNSTTGTGPIDSQSEVVIDYKTAKDYKTGVNANNKTNLTVFSTGKFQIDVKAADVLKTEDGKTMETNNFKIEAFDVLGERVGSVTLGNADQELIQGQAGKEQLYNIYYKGEGGNVFIDKIIENRITTYKTKVIYSISVS